jgi:hypothetical protein
VPGRARGDGCARGPQAQAAVPEGQVRVAGQGRALRAPRGAQGGALVGGEEGEGRVALACARGG